MTVRPSTSCPLERLGHFERLEARRLFATIGGTVHTDRDADGRIEANDPGLAGVEVFIDANANDVRDAGELTTTSDANGRYAFDVPAGTYRVNQARATNDVRTVPGSGRLWSGHGYGSTSLPTLRVREWNPLTGQYAADTGTGEATAATTVNGAFATTPAAVTGGLTSLKVRDLTIGDASPLSVATSISEPIGASAVLGEEAFLRHQNADLVSVVDRATGATRRTLTLPAGAAPGFAAMADRDALLVATAAELRWLDPQTGAVTRTVPLVGGPASAALRVAYLNGTAYATWNTSGTREFAAVDVETGHVGNRRGLGGQATLLNGDSSSNLVTVPEGGVATLDFARAAYTPAADVPVVLTNHSRDPSDTVRISIRGTIAGATLTLFDAYATERNRPQRTFAARAGTTVIDVRPGDILVSGTAGGVDAYAVSQQSDGSLAQQYAAVTLVGRPIEPSPGGWVSGTFLAQLVATPNASPGFVASARPEFKVFNFFGTQFGLNPSVELFADGQSVGSRVGAGTNDVVRPDQPLPDGAHEFAMIVRETPFWPARTLAWQAMNGRSYALTIDTVAPVAATTYAFDDAAPGVRLRADEPILGQFAADDVRLERLNAAGSAEAVVTDVQVTAASGTDVTIRPAAGGPFADGRYRVSVRTIPTVRDRAGNPLVVPPADFFVLAGDANRDARVDFADLVVIAQAYGATGRTFGGGNFDYDAEGRVDFADLVTLAQRYGTTLAAPPDAALPEAVALATTPSRTTATKRTTRRAAADVLGT